MAVISASPHARCSSLATPSGRASSLHRLHPDRGRFHQSVTHTLGPRIRPLVLWIVHLARVWGHVSPKWWGKGIFIVITGWVVLSGKTHIAQPQANFAESQVCFVFLSRCIDILRSYIDRMSIRIFDVERPAGYVAVEHRNHCIYCYVSRFRLMLMSVHRRLLFPALTKVCLSSFTVKARCLTSNRASQGGCPSSVRQQILDIESADWKGTFTWADPTLD